MVDIIKTALSGLNAATARAGVAANNIANAGNIGAIDPKNGPAAYTPQDIISVSTPTGGITTTVQSRAPATVEAYDPNNPYADPETGQIAVPNIDLAHETIQLKMAEIAYKSSAAVMRTTSQMQDALLKIIDKRV